MATVGAGVNRHTGKPQSGFDDAVDKVECIFTTDFGTRPMRRWFGSYLPRLLGENIDPSTVLRFFTAIYAALSWEPRFVLTQVNFAASPEEMRQGELEVWLDVIYRPRAHLGDYTSEGPRRISIALLNDRVVARGVPL